MIGTLIGLIIMLPTRYIANWYRDGSCDVNDIIWVCTCEYDCNPSCGKVYRGIEDLYTEKKFVIEAISELYRGQIPSKLKVETGYIRIRNKGKKVKGAA